jgi:phosphotriesterase-related protein
MAKINGVLGPIDTADLGFTLMHEHILVANWSMRQAFDDWVDVDAISEEASKSLKEIQELGVRTIVDLTPINLGRDIHLIREVAERSGIQIVAATGFYWTEDPFYTAWDADVLAGHQIREINEGIQGTETRAGIIKCATDAPGVTELNRKLLQAAARAHRATGVPISTHTSVEHHTGTAQQDVFEADGVDLSRVVIGHCGDTEDADHLEEILKRGSFIGMDRFGIDMILSTEKRVSTIAELCRRGYADQMVLSHDACCHIDWFPMDMVRATSPQWNYRHIPADVVPALGKEGVTEQQIEAMTVTNPRRVFERQGSY